MQKIEKTPNNTHTKTQERKSNSFGAGPMAPNLEIKSARI